MITRKAIPYLVTVGLVLAVLFVAYQFGVSAENNRWQAIWSAHLAEDAKSTAAHQAQLRAIEDERRQAVNLVTENAQTKIEEMASAADAADAYAGRLRDKADQLAAELERTSAAVSACTTAASKAAAENARMLADVFKRADERAGHLAGVADQAIERGLACERAYDSLRQSQSAQR